MPAEGDQDHSGYHMDWPRSVEDNVLVDSQRLAFAGPVTTAGLTDVEDQAEPTLLTAVRFRQGIQHLAGGVTVVTSGDDDGVWYGVTTTSVCALSVEPPTLIACVRRRSRIGQQLGRTRRFCVNLLSQDQHTVAEAFAVRRSLEADRFRHGQWVCGTTGSPVLMDGLASFECGIDLIYGYPSHVLVIGSVQQVRHTAAPASPLVSIAGQFGQVTSTVP
jgi:flavin reductase (DIM6/NTAB) family NADH-FMN oxidoreductase RutF